MEINYKAMREAAMHHEQETKQKFSDDLRKMQENAEAHKRRINTLLLKAHEQQSERKRQAIEQKIDKKVTAVALEAVKDKYNDEPSRSLEIDTKDGYKWLARNLK